MKKLFIYICLFQSFALTAQSLTEWEDKRFEAQMQKDTAALADMVSENLLFIHSNAFEEDKKAFLENVGAGSVVYSRMQAEPNREVLYQKKQAIVRGILQVAGTYKGGAFDIRVRYTAIYKKKKKTWVLLNWQSTKIPA